jgi:hypothetical protein
MKAGELVASTAAMAVNLRCSPELYFVPHFTAPPAAWLANSQWSLDMPTDRALARARKDQRQGKSASTQAGEFVREEIERIREGVHGARSPEQAIAIGLSQARRAGIDVPVQKGAKSGEGTRKKPTARKRATTKAASVKRSRATLQALKRESTTTASHEALSRHARKAAAARTPAERSAAAKKAARAKGPAVRKAAAKKAAATGASSRAAGAVRAARTRAMRSRSR